MGKILPQIDFNTIQNWKNLMNRLAIPVILAAIVMAAGIFAFMPVEKASTVHTIIQTTVGTLQVVACTQSQTGGSGTGSSCTFTTTGNAMIIHQITVSAAGFASHVGGGVTTLDTIGGVAPGGGTVLLNFAASTPTIDDLTSSTVVGQALIGAGVDGSVVTSTTAVVGGTTTGNIVTTLIASSTGTISAS